MQILRYKEFLRGLVNQITVLAAVGLLAALPLASAAPAGPAEVIAVQQGGMIVSFNPQDAVAIEGLSGNGLIDVTARYSWPAGANFALLPPELSGGVEHLTMVRELTVRYIFRPATDGAPAVRVVLERVAKDAAGNTVWWHSAEPLTAESRWPTLAAVEEQLLAGVLALPELRQVKTGAADRRLKDSGPFLALNEGFMGLAWGMTPDQIPGLVPYEQSPAGLSLFKASLPGRLTRFRVSLADNPYSSRIPGTITLVFAPGEGLVQGYLTFPGDKADAAELGLIPYLGAPVMLEPLNSLMPVPTTWYTGNTRVEVMGIQETVVVFSRRDFVDPRR